MLVLLGPPALMKALAVSARLRGTPVLRAEQRRTVP